MTIKKKISTLVLSFAIVLCAILGVSLLSRDTKTAEALSSAWSDSQEYYDRLEVGENDFSIVAMGDHQIAVTNDTWLAYVKKSYEYIAQNADDMNLKMYINLGDVFDVVDFSYLENGIVGMDPYNTAGNGAEYGANRGGGGAMGNNMYFWQQLQTNVKFRTMLTDAKVPNIWLMGNHDYEDMAQSYRIKETFNKAYPVAMYDDYKITDSNSDGIINEDDFTEEVAASGKYFGGSLYEDVENSYYYFMGNGKKYMMLNLGLHPDMDIVNWASTVIKQNPNCFVIVSTHAYFYGNGSNHIRCEKGEDRVWKKLVTGNDNVKMVLCGHSCTSNGGIYKRVDFNDSGNPVYQFMINSQDSTYGGAGVFSQLIFRENGDIDVSYIAPAFEGDDFATEVSKTEGQGMFFTEDSQFTFNYSKTVAATVETERETVYGNSVSDTYLYDKFFLSNSADNRRWAQNLYAFNNIQSTKGNGLSVIDSTKAGYVVYHFDKPDGNVFKQIEFEIDGSLNDFADGTTAIYQWDYSFDGINWEVGSYSDTNIGRIKCDRKLTYQINNCEDLYIRFVLKADSNTYVSTLTFDVDYVQVEYEGDVLDIDYDMTKLTESNYDEMFLNDMDTSGWDGFTLSTGDKKDHVAGYGEFTLRLDSGSDKNFETLSFSAVMKTEDLGEVYYARTTEKVIDAETRESIDGVKDSPITLDAWTATIKDSDKYAFKLYVSVDNGENFTLVHTEATPGAKNEHVVSPIDLSSYVDGKKSVQIKIEFFGIRPSQGGFRSFAIDGTYDAAPAPTYDMNGGVSYGADETVVYKDGYEFEGWHLNTVDGEKVNPSEYANQNVSLVAKWNKLYRITYVLSGGVNDAENLSVVAAGTTVVLKDATRDGYKFLGWFDAEGHRVTTFTAGAHTVLYAAWYQL